MENEQPIIEAERTPEESRKVKWTRFVESTLINFFHDNKLEKITVEDGFGNKARLSKTKGDDLKIEQSSTTIL